MKKVINMTIDIVVTVPDHIEVEDINKWVLDHCFVGKPRSVVNVKVNDMEVVDNTIKMATILPQRGTPKAMDIPDEVEPQSEDDNAVFLL